MHPAAHVDPPLVAPGTLQVPWQREGALRELLRGRMEVLGPMTERALALQCGVPPGDVELALLGLESEGVVLRGAFTPGLHEREWCDRRLLARIHRYTLNRLRAEIEPVSTADFMRFLFRWQHVEPGHRMSGAEGLAAVLEQLDGYELAAAAWERDVLAARVERYTPELLDGLCVSGRVSWGRVSPVARNGRTPRLTRSSPVALFQRRSAALWLTREQEPAIAVSGDAARLREALQRRGASFIDELALECDLPAAQVAHALGELAAAGVVASDGFTGLRALLRTPATRRAAGLTTRRAAARRGMESTGRWALLARPAAGAPERGDAERVRAYARVLLRRYGVVFRRLVAREANTPSWRDLVMVYRRMEARGEVRGGRFVAGVSGEQFALVEAVPALRALRNQHRTDSLVSISAADPLNLIGIVTPGERVPALASNRVLFRDGVPLAALEKGALRRLGESGDLDERRVRAALARPVRTNTARLPIGTPRHGARPSSIARITAIS